ncbi:BTB/POZ domain-containing protein 17-like [Glandiceps talaboti]
MAQTKVRKPPGEWFDNSGQLVNSFAALYNNPAISDVVIHVGKDKYYAHRVFLANASDVFKIMLTNNTWKDSYQTEIYLDEPYTQSMFGEFLQYMYTGHIYITTNNAVLILMLADKYNVVTLKESCEAFMLKNFVTTPEQSCVLSWYQYSKRCSHTQLERLCYKFIEQNIDVILDSPDWAVIEKETLLTILGSSDIIVSSEYKLYMAAEQWLKDPLNEGNIKEELKDILPHIRFPMMTPRQLTMIEKHKIVQEHWDIYKEYMLQAYRFNAVPLCVREEDFEDDEIYMHRNYTDPEHGICNSIEIKHYSQRKTREYSCFIETAMTGSSVDTAHKYKWDLQFWPKGHQKPALTEFGNAYLLQTEDVTLAINPHGRMEDKFEIAVTFKTCHNGLMYVEDVKQYTHDFDAKMMFRVKNLIDLSDLKAGTSQYLNNDNLLIDVIIRRLKNY